MKLPHLFHRDPNWRQRGLHAYHECRCGARRVRHVVRGHRGPVEAGWPQLVDRHGRPIMDSGWRRP